jgi:broad specificity phosphatase PhoE
MDRLVWIITHADVALDPKVPVPDWGLNDRGTARHDALAETWKRVRPAPDAVWASTERKARDGAAPLAAAFGLELRTDAALGENDRSATGFIPEPAFSRVASTFFANPDASIRGWERARDAQARIVAAVDRVIAKSPGAGEIAIVTHGGVATLLLCARLGCLIDESRGPGIAGGGGICAVRGSTLRRAWRAIEAADALDL